MCSFKHIFFICIFNNKLVLNIISHMHNQALTIIISQSGFLNALSVSTLIGLISSPFHFCWTYLQSAFPKWIYISKAKNGFLLTKSNLSTAPFLLFLLIITDVYTWSSVSLMALNFAICSYISVLFLWETVPTFTGWMMPDSQISTLDWFLCQLWAFSPSIFLTIWKLQTMNSELDS